MRMSNRSSIAYTKNQVLKKANDEPSSAHKATTLVMNCYFVLTAKNN